MALLLDPSQVSGQAAWDDLLKRAPSLPESTVVEMMTADDFQELPEQLKQALADRLLELEIKPADHHLG